MIYIKIVGEENTMPELIRSFIAFDIDNEGVLERLSEAQERLVNTGTYLKLIKPKNIHITMRFLGNIRIELVDRIHNEMEKVVFTPFDIEIRGVGAFPNLRFARVIWAGIQKGAKKLEDIADQLEPWLQNLGIRPDKKGFSPHITIARVKTGHNKAKLANCINELASYEFGVLRVDCIKLKKSILTPKGPIYSTLIEICRR